MIDDPALAAAVHLTGPHAADVLAAGVEATGAVLVDSRVADVQYRPESDLVVRYAATVRRPDGALVADTLLAGVTRQGVFPGTLPVEAITESSEPVVAGLWRWPFDPVLADLGRIVTPARAEEALQGIVSGPLRVEVVVYRPCERVVVRVTEPSGRQVYVKLVAPHAVEGVVTRHERLAAAGIPVPQVLAVGDSWIAMSALIGPTLRDVIKSGPLSLSVDRTAPAGAEITAMCAALGAADLGHLPSVRPRLLDASAHAAMLARVIPEQANRFSELAERFADEANAVADRCGAVVHGDLHEGQLVVHQGRIVGLLDIDDAGPGDPVDDMATLLAHLAYRSVSALTPRTDLDEYAGELRDAFSTRVDPVALDTATAGVLVGLATGPFRAQRADWQASVINVIDAATARLDGVSDPRR